MPQRDYRWCIIVAKYGALLFTEIGAVVITDYKPVARHVLIYSFESNKTWFCEGLKELEVVKLERLSGC